jgi:hypothetical protein
LDLPFARLRRRNVWIARGVILALVPAWAAVVLVYAHRFSSLSYAGGLAALVWAESLCDYYEVYAQRRK